LNRLNKKKVCDETTSTEIQSSAAEAIPEPASNYPNAVSAEPVFPQTTTLPTMPNTRKSKLLQLTSHHPLSWPKRPALAQLERPVDVVLLRDHSCQLTPTFEMDALDSAPASRLVMMRLACTCSLSQPNLQVSFEAAKIQPVGGTLGTLRMLPSRSAEARCEWFAFICTRGIAGRP
jgi:hypothetical protein